MRPPVRLCALLFVFFGLSEVLPAQPGIEPPVRGIAEFQTPLDFGLRSGASFNVSINNFGFGVSGEYRRVVSPLSEAFIELQMTALRDVTEQNYQFFGQQIIPNKRNRIMSFPLTAGFKHRLFPEPISDNFRLFTSIQGGVNLAFVYPYYNLRNVAFIMADDLDGVTAQNIPFEIGFVEANTGQFVNDVFQGWGDGSWQLGYTGKLAVGVDFGDDFRTITTVKLGATFSYFSEGIQVMDPFNAIGLIQGNADRPDIYVIEEGTPRQKLFVSPFITLSFGGMW